MLFTTPTFALFCLLTFLLYYLPQLRRVQLGVLILASFVFYGSENPALLILLFASIGLNSFISFAMAGESLPVRRAWAVGGIAVNLLLLGFFKYAGLFAHFFQSFTPGHSIGPFEWLTRIPLPIGISFYTFEGISLLVDTFRGTGSAPASANADARPSFKESLFSRLKKTSLFIAFFPHLVAGPILRAKEFIPQIGPKRFRDIDWDTTFRALISGYFLKMCVADNLKDYTAQMIPAFIEIRDAVTNASLLFGYSMQIFADFAGYSLIAVGLGAAFGYVLPQNFRAPYISRTLAEFWTRWHISLSSWLRDYLYIPLGGNRLGKARTYLNLFVVMTLGGLWHGAAWSYAAWGFYHGLGLAFERLVSDRMPRRDAAQSSSWPVKAIQILSVFLFVSVGWVFFKLTDYRQAFAFLAKVLTGPVAPSWMIIAPVLLFSLPVILLHLHALKETPREAIATKPSPGRVVFDLLLYGTMLALLLVNRGTSTAFIYFQF